MGVEHQGFTPEDMYVEYLLVMSVDSRANVITTHDMAPAGM